MKLKRRRISVVVATLGLILVWLFANPESYEVILNRVDDTGAESVLHATDDGHEGLDGKATLAIDLLQKLDVKGRAPKAGYTREEFYPG